MAENTKQGARVWDCMDCHAQLTEQEMTIHECIGEDIPFMLKRLTPLEQRHLLRGR